MNKKHCLTAALAVMLAAPTAVATQTASAQTVQPAAKELEYGKILPETKETFRKIAERMIAEEGIQAVVLGCTELPLIFSTIELPVPYLDVMHIHIDALIDLAAKH